MVDLPGEPTASRKPYLYVPFQSCHPWHTKVGNVRGETHFEFFQKRLRERGYPGRFVRLHMEKQVSRIRNRSLGLGKFFHRRPVQSFFLVVPYSSTVDVSHLRKMLRITSPGLTGCLQRSRLGLAFRMQRALFRRRFLATWRD